MKHLKTFENLTNTILNYIVQKLKKSELIIEESGDCYSIINPNNENEYYNLLFYDRYEDDEPLEWYIDGYDGSKNIREDINEDDVEKLKQYITSIVSKKYNI